MDVPDYGYDTNAGVVGGILNGIGEGFKNYVDVQQSKQKLQMAQDKNESDINYQNALADKAEAEGSISGLQADQMRDYIKNNKKMADAQFDNAGMIQDSVEDRLHRALSSHLNDLQGIASTPDGQQAIQNHLAQQNQGTSQGQPQGQPQGPQPNSVVNAIMPGVGANNTPYSDTNPPPMSMVGGGTNEQPQAAPQGPVVAPPAPGQGQGSQPAQGASNAQPNANEGQSGGLPPIRKIFPESSDVPFGKNSQQDWFTMSPEGKIIQKTPEMINVENPMHLSPYQKQITDNADNLIKAGYSREQILQELPPDQAKQLSMVGNYKMKLSEATSAWRMSQEYKTAFQGTLGDLFPNYDENKFPARHDYMDGLAKTTPNSVGGQANSLNTLAMHLGELNSQLLVNKNGGVPAGNALVNFVNQNLGHPEVNTFNAAKDIFSAEMNRLLSGKAATVSGIKEAVSNLNQNSSSNQLRGVIKTYANMTSDRINSLRDQYQDTMDEPENGRILKSGSRKILTSIMGNDKFAAHDSGQDANDLINSNLNQQPQGVQKDFSKFWTS